MSKRKLRILIARFGNGYENAMLKLAHSCCEAGFEVVYTELQDPDAICSCALQEGIDHIGITALPGASTEQFARLFDSLEKNGLSHIRVTAGGLFPEEEIERIKRMGVIDFYPSGSIYDKIEKWRQEHGDLTESQDCAKFVQKPTAAETKR